MFIEGERRVPLAFDLAVVADLVARPEAELGALDDEVLGAAALLAAVGAVVEDQFAVVAARGARRLALVGHGGLQALAVQAVAGAALVVVAASRHQRQLRDAVAAPLEGAGAARAARRQIHALEPIRGAADGVVDASAPLRVATQRRTAGFDGRGQLRDAECARVDAGVEHALERWLAKQSRQVECRTRARGDGGCWRRRQLRHRERLRARARLHVGAERERDRAVAGLAAVADGRGRCVAERDRDAQQDLLVLEAEQERRRCPACIGAVGVAHGGEQVAGHAVSVGVR